MDYILLKYQKVYPFNCSNVSYVQMAGFFYLVAPLLCAHTLRQKEPLIVISPIRPNLKNLSNESKCLALLFAFYYIHYPGNHVSQRQKPDKASHLHSPAFKHKKATQSGDRTKAGCDSFQQTRGLNPDGFAKISE
ncbi:TPA: hypothetical protein ACS3EQ_001328 [Klebsiella aerogenes]